jgi:multidrug efflux pump subunit AcrA (membrane-fusion protein)
MTTFLRKLVLVFLGFLLPLSAEPSSLIENQKAPVFVFAEAAKKTEIFDALSFPARIQPKVSANILAETDGVLTQIFTPIGSAVKKETVLALIKNTDPIYDYAPARVVSPVQGIVSSVEISQGSHVNRGQKLMRIMDPGQLIVSIEVPQKDLKFISAGLKGNFSQSGSQEEMALVVVGVSPFVDPLTGTATAELKPESVSRAAVFLGGLGQVHFKVNPNQGFQLPETAIVYRGKKTFVRVVDKGVAKYVAVELGESRKGNVQVVKGLADGVQVILRSSRFLSEGDPVTVTRPEEPKS